MAAGLLALAGVGASQFGYQQHRGNQQHRCRGGIDEQSSPAKRRCEHPQLWLLPFSTMACLEYPNVIGLIVSVINNC